MLSVTLAGIVVGVFEPGEAAVDEEPFDVAVAGTAGVAGEVHPLGEIVDAPDAGGQPPHPVLLELGGLVQEDHVVLSALIPGQIAVGGAVAEVDDAAARKGEAPGGGVVGRGALQFGPEEADVVALQLRQGAAEDEDADAGVAQGQELCLGADGPGLAAAPGAAEGDVFLFTGEELPLFFAGRLDGEDHRYSPFSSPFLFSL